jgi:uncharacterized protein (DUF58 family)
VTPPLIPPAVTAQARSRKRLPFGFGFRFFIGLLLGLLWVVPAWWSPKLIAAMFLWDAFVLAAWFIDLRRLPLPRLLEARRVWKSPLSFGRGSSASIDLRNSSGVPIRASVIDETPLALRETPPELDLAAGPGRTASAEYSILPARRGDSIVGRLFLRYQTSLGIAERWAVADLSQSVRVLPDMEQAKRHALFLIRSRQMEMEKRRRRQRGAGREFETLRGYREGDEPRDICWTATARRHQLMTRVYQAERSQTVWIVVDAGRLLRAQIDDVQRAIRATKLDYGVDAALSLAQVASQSGDQVALLAYGRSVQQLVGAGRGPRHLRTILDSLALVRGEAAEANHGLAARVLLETQSRRSLIVWITDFAETPMTPEVIEYATRMTQRHVVVFAAMSQPDLFAVAAGVPENEEEMFRHTAALEVVERRDLLLRRLRQRGVLAVDLAPGDLASALVNKYLEVKDRSLI